MPWRGEKRLPEIADLHPEGDRKLTVPETAHLLRGSPDYIHKLIQSGHLESTRASPRKTLVFEADVLYEHNRAWFLEHPRVARLAGRPVTLSTAGRTRFPPIERSPNRSLNSRRESDGVRDDKPTNAR